MIIPSDFRKRRRDFFNHLDHSSRLFVYFFFFSFIITSIPESFIVYLGKKYQVFNNS